MVDFKLFRELAKDFKVLYVEDEESARLQISQVLKNFFKEVIVAIDGEDGLKKYKENSDIDLIITDISMPKMNGLDMSKYIKSISKEQKVLIFSAHSEKDYLIEAIKIGIDGFILKPLEMRQFSEAIYKILNSIKEKRENVKYKEHLEELVDTQTKEIKEKSKLLQKQMEIDELTQIFNRVKLNQDIKEKKGDNLIFINIDNFDHFNTTYGYEKGDILLKKIVDFLQKYQREDMNLYRAGGDEFAFLSSYSMDEAKEFAKRLQYDISSKKFNVSIINFNFSFTIGIAKGDNLNLLKNANIAIKEIREIGKNRVGIYHPNSYVELKQKNILKWIYKVKEANEYDLITPFYQPILNMKTRKIEKYECLARIKDKDKVFSPYHFIEPAKLAGMLPNITKTMIEKSFKYFKDNNLNFSINITDADLKEGYLIEFLHECLCHYNIDPNRVILEILENISSYDVVHSYEQLSVLKDMGFKLAIDDFGADNSNFSRIHNLNVNYIKIDGSFIKEVDKNLNSYKIVYAIVQYAKSMGVQTIAEFVHSKDVFDKIDELGIDYSQGYYISEPTLEIK